MDNVTPIEVDILKNVIDVSCDVLDQAVLAYDRSDTLIFASKQVLRYFPLDPEDLMPGTHMRKLFGAVYDCTQRYHKPDVLGQPRKSRDDWVAERIALQWNERFGNVERYAHDRWLNVCGRRMANGIGITVMQEVTEATKLENRWRSEMEHMASTEAVLDQMPCPLIVKDKDMTYVGVNKAFCDLRGLRPEQVLGKTAWDINESALAATFEASDLKVLETGETGETIEEVVGPDGLMRRYLRRDFRVGKPGQYFLVAMMDDISGFQGAEESVRKVETAVAERKEEFVQNENIVPESELGEPETEEPVGRVLVVSGNVEFSNICIDLLKRYGFDACAAETLAELDVFLAEAKRLDLLPDLVLVDAEMGDEGAATADKADIAALVIDSGRPVHFLIADVMANMPASREKVEFDYDGPDITHFAPPGLPVFEGPDELPTYRYSDIEVLVVEDNSINQEVFSSILDSLGIMFRVAANGEEAIALYDELHPKLVLLDVTLPDVDGFTVATRMAEAAEKRSGRVPIIGVLPREDAGNEARCIQAGMKGCIVKPISTESIELLYNRYVNTKVKAAHKEERGR